MNAYKQEGQTLVFVLGFTLVLAVALIYLFNTSQLLAERTQAKVLADHAVYNTAIKQAQLLNANAYMNKAKIANQLATAQAVSVSSWAKHFEPMPENTQHIKLIPYIGPEIHEGITVATENIQIIPKLASVHIHANNIATKSISLQQSALNNASIEAIMKVHSDTVSQSSIGRGFDSKPLLITSKYAVNPNPLANDFIKNYSGNSSDPKIGRRRLKDVVLASRDDFTLKRRPKNTTDFKIPIFKNKLVARGGTEISNDLNQWKGVDTFSHHYRFWKTKKWKLPKLKSREDQIGYGSALISSSGSDNDTGNYVGYDDARNNWDASKRSHQYTPSWDSRKNNKFSKLSETGVPSFWDLDSKFLSLDEPTLPVSILITKKSSNLDTTSGASGFKVGSALDITSSDNINAVSTAEVYFERPLQDRRGNNTYLNKKKFEKASLINPYWQVRLKNNTSASIAEARLNE